MLNITMFVNNLFPFTSNLILTSTVRHLYIKPEAYKTTEWHELVNRMAGFDDLVAHNGDQLKSTYNKHSQEERRATSFYDHARTAAFETSGIIIDIQEMKNFKRSSPRIESRFTPEYSKIVAPYQHSKYTTLKNAITAAEKLNNPTPGINQGLEILLQETLFKPYEQRALEVEFGIPAGAKPGEFIVYNLSQRTEGFLTGGYTVIIKKH